MVIYNKLYDLYSLRAGAVKHLGSLFSRFIYIAGSFLLGATAIETERGFLLNLWVFFHQSVGFPFDIQGPCSSCNVLLHFLHNKAIEDGNQTCSPPFLLGLVGRMTYLDLTLNI